ncbi:hypothetical protein [Paenibacillus wenxiniae]|uniref:Uncharacterized protein n=1 Tax=Paenibacillus wenxiniae TaxID=1636843 RepID=A0ABW4RJU2_9BACL
METIICVQASSGTEETGRGPGEAGSAWSLQRYVPHQKAGG